MKKRVDPEKATDPVSKALAAYQAQQDVMNPAGSSLHLEPSMNTMGRVDPPASKATTSYQTFGCIQEMCATPSTNGPLQTGEQFYNPISANLAPPLVTYPSLLQNMRNNRRETSILKEFLVVELFLAIPGLVCSHPRMLLQCQDAHRGFQATLLTNH
jgi:hypothetical protein